MRIKDSLRNQINGGICLLSLVDHMMNSGTHCCNFLFDIADRPGMYLDTNCITAESLTSR